MVSLCTLYPQPSRVATVAYCTLWNTRSSPRRQTRGVEHAASTCHACEGSSEPAWLSCVSSLRLRRQYMNEWDMRLCGTVDVRREGVGRRGQLLVERGFAVQ